jgi:DNA-binding MurR/RpiR family transcriptional regulator
LVGRLKSRLESLSEAKGKVARYLVANWDKAAFMTAAQIGEASGSSGTVVIRLAEELGYSGFPALQHDLQAGVHEELSGAGRLEKSLELADPVAASLERNVARLRQIAIANPACRFDSLADLLLSARSVCVMGMRSAHGPALVLGQDLLYLRPSVHVVPEPAADWYDILKFFTKEDLLLTVSFTRYWRMTIEAMEYAREKGIPVATITDMEVSPAAQAADIVLLTTTDSTSFALSYTGCSAVIDALLASVGRKVGRENAGALTELEAIYRRSDLFYGAKSVPAKEGTEKGNKRGGAS